MPAAPLRCVVSVSGIRGIIGEDLDVAQVLELARACGHALAGGGRVVLGRDSRTTGAMLAQAVAAGLRSDLLWTPWVLVAMTAVALAVQAYGGHRWDFEAAVLPVHAAGWAAACAVVAAMAVGVDGAHGERGQ